MFRSYLYTCIVRRIGLCLAAGYLILIPELKGQIYSFKNFGASSSIPDTYIYTINQDQNGFLWVGTGNGIAKFDGITFHTVPYPDSINTRYPKCSFRDRTGRIWFGCSDGTLFYTLNGELVKFRELGFQSISQIVQSDEEYISVIPQEKSIVKISINDPERVIKYNVPRGLIMTCAAFLTENTMLLGTTENLLFCRFERDSVKIVSRIKGIEYTRIQCIFPIDGAETLLIGTEGSGIYILEFKNGSPEIEKLENKTLSEELNVKSFFRGSNEEIWMATMGSGLIKFSYNSSLRNFDNVELFTVSNGLQSNDVTDVFEDSEGNIWTGLYGEGISMLYSRALYIYTPGDLPEKNNIINVSLEGSKYFLGTPTGFYYFDPSSGKVEGYTELRNKINIEISAYLYENSSTIWAGTRGKGLYLTGKNGQIRQVYFSENSGQNYIRHIAAEDQNLWLSTLDGIVVINKNTGKVIRKFNIEDRLPHNSINQIIFLQNGEALPATECDRLYRVTLSGGVEIGRRVMSGITRNKVLCFAEDDHGDIWAATAGNGIFWFTGDSVNNFTTYEGLFSNFCYSILADSSGQVWVGHERGFSVFDPHSGLLKKYSPDFMKSSNCNPNSIAVDHMGRILFGTTEGLVIYDKRLERAASVVPKTNLISITINNIRYPLRKEYVLPYSKYTIKIEYVGINLRNPEEVYYSTKMDNWDNEWSGLKTERQTTYSLRDGKYKFNVISYNAAGQSDHTPVSVEFVIKTPFWRTLYFILLVIFVIAGTVILIVRQREKAQEKVKKYLEDELEKRTSEVVKQKEMIEMQNLEITDSINYARRIQSSILPDVNKLKETFSDSFVIFYPRDIVSGDFYWFDRIDNDRFMLVCADSTGHGVPGAFMSMIGATLLQDIIVRKGVTKPSQILTMLDKQIISTLNQNVDVGVSNDGMDMVICEINITERHIKLASAMRPIIIIMGGELYYIKGNKYSVGGESVTEKYFDDLEYYLSKGDSVYLFSDGFPDQFGGPDGKKMKIARFKSLIEEVHSLPMAKQKEVIEKFFFDWKNDYAQVDDVLVIGIRF